MPKCDFSEVAKQLYCNCTSAWVFFCKFAAIFQKAFRAEFFPQFEENICRLFDVLLAQFLFTTSEMVLDYYQQKVNVWVASRVAEQFKTKNLWKLGNFKKVLENAQIIW